MDLRTGGRLGRRLGSFSHNARHFLISSMISALSHSIHWLIFNLYIDTSGYSRQFLGELQSMPFLVSMIGTLPITMVVDRIGRKQALILATIGRLIAGVGIVVAPGPWMLRLSMIASGLSGTLYMVSAAPFMMENSTEEERDGLFSASYGLQTLVGFAGTLVGGYLPTIFGGLLSVGVESVPAYRATLAVMAALYLVATVPLLRIGDRPRTGPVEQRSLFPWHNVTDKALVLRIFAPNIIISMGAAILIPYMNLFFKETYMISDRTLGALFAVSSVVTGLATLASPMLARRWGRIRSLVMTQLVSIPFLLAIGFSPHFWVSGVAFWARAALMNMGNPLYSAFAMGQVPERERATVSGLMGMSWNIGWAIGPYLSGYMQQHPQIGFQPIFVVTCSLYLVASIMTSRFFQRIDNKQRLAAQMRALGVTLISQERVR
jgi:MFS family permease